MWPYWLLFLLAASAAFMQPASPWRLPPSTSIRSLHLRWIVVVLVLTLFVGWRYRVGGDWDNYLEHWSEVANLELLDTLDRGDPGYWGLTWVVQELGGSIYTLNLIFGAIFSFGLVFFCQNQPRPWLAFAVAVPYMVIVLGMGYTRQGVALGCVMVGLVALSQKRILPFVAWVAVGALFHKSAVVLVPLGMLATRRNRVVTTFWIIVAAGVLYQFLLRASVDDLVANYVESEYASEGALIRVLMNVVPAVILLRHRTKIQDPEERGLWLKIAILALLSVVWLALSPSSTAVDRLALYLIPLQIYLFARLPDLLARRGESRRLYVGAVLAYYACVQFVWLFFAEHARYWLPYRFYPFTEFG